MPRHPTSSPAIRTVGELALIQQIRTHAGRSRGAVRLGIGDDCAILRPTPGEELVITTDFSLEGRHFRRDWHPARSAGHRTLARGLSDIAAMGARPLAAFLSLALPVSIASDRRWIREFLDGLLALANVHGVQLAGGDTSQAPGDSVLADIMVVGAAPSGKALRRSGARVGHSIYVTGALGGAAAELVRLQAAPQRVTRAIADDTQPHLFPQPRIATGRALLQRELASAAMDISDGLSTDLHHLCEASGVGAEIDAELLPVHPLAAGLPSDERMRAVLHGGEDYELLFTAPAATRLPAKLGGVPITRIGKIVRASGVTLINDSKRHKLAAQGWEHFRT